MQKIYGYREKDVLGLIEFINENKAKTLSAIFMEYAKHSKKSSGTVRNLYYAIAKHSNKDLEFSKKYLGGKPLKVNKSLSFDQGEERALIKEILRTKEKVKSIRKSIEILSKGDPSLALRYQNKFRNVLKNQKALVIEIIQELKEEGVFLEGFSILETEQKQTLIDFEPIKKAVLEMTKKSLDKLKKENQKLREKVSFLENENYRLINAVCSSESIKNDSPKSAPNTLFCAD